jgi:protocatechuate 3,4-dioxygenase beta subunit
MLPSSPQISASQNDFTHDPRLMLKRRDALRMGALGAAAIAGLGLAGGARRAQADTNTVCLTQGPFWVDEQLFRSDVRSDPSTGLVQTGLPLRLSICVARLSATGVPTPLSGAWVDIWHASSAGAYSDASGSGNPNEVGKKYLRGYQITDSHGMVRFTTVYPGWYIGRATHIHFRIRTWNGSTVVTNFTTQCFFNETINTAIYSRVAAYSHSGTRTLNASDGIYNTTGAGSAALTRLADNLTFAVASFNIKLAPAATTCGALIKGYGEDGTELACEDDHAFDFGGGTPSLALRQFHEASVPVLDGPRRETGILIA